MNFEAEILGLKGRAELLVRFRAEEGNAEDLDG
jgi:hypothetical protein